MKERLTGLDGLRGIAALLIMWGHCAQDCFGQWGGSALRPIPYLPGGALTLFFVLSGFLCGYFADKNTGSIRDYYKKRARRILPTYYGYIAAVTLIYVLLGRSSEILTLPLGFYVLPLGIIPFCSGIEAITPFVHLWFISAILLFYLICPWIIKWSGQKLKNTALTLSIGTALLKFALYILAGKDTVSYRLVGASQFDSIFLGMFIGAAAKDGLKILETIKQSRAAAALSILLFLTSSLYADRIPAPARNEYYAILFSSIILCLTSDKPIITFKGKFWSILSEASYGIYVIHIFVIILLSRIYNSIGFEAPGILATIGIYIAITLFTISAAQIISNKNKKHNICLQQ